MIPKPRWWMETPDGGLRPSTLAEAAPLMGTDAARVARDEEDGKVVSTVFLGYDHDGVAGLSDPNMLPLIYESMTFGLPDGDEPQERYRTREDALAGHAQMCREYLGREPRGE